MRGTQQRSLTLADLLAPTGAEPGPLRTALRHERELGRVTLDASGHRLVPGAFDQGTLAALRALAL